MRRVLVSFLIVLMALPCAAQQGETVFCGRSLGHEGLDDVEVNCPENAICLHGWFRWRLKVDRVLSGNSLPSHLVAARTQHGAFRQAYEMQLRRFSVKSIEDEGQRRLLGADYYLMELPAVNEEFTRACPATPRP